MAHRLRKTFTILGITTLALLANCTQKPAQDNTIQYNLGQAPYRIANNSQDQIEILPRTETYLIIDSGWNRTSLCFSCVSTSNNLVPKEFLPSGGDWIEPLTESAKTCVSEVMCDFLRVRRYMVTGIPSKVYLVYSGEPTYWNQSTARQSKLRVSFAANNPFNFAINSHLEESVWLCWTGLAKRGELDWGQDSRLERQTEYGTWEVVPHNLDLCATFISGGEEIMAGTSTKIDATKAYPDYLQLPEGTYRWAIVISPRTGADRLIFSESFELGGSTTLKP
jgi:hypothetical protein